ncbi:MAG: hypothetical protein GY847_24550 [Proteobacteria bacterium]|nr:hypothetical protein [Pseudomonadota bacterium]
MLTSPSTEGAQHKPGTEPMEHWIGMRIFRRIHIVIAIGLALVGASYLYLFRQKSVDNSALGTITYKFKWGMAREILVDTNRDGINDARGIIAGSFGEFWTHDPPLEHWESSQCDGYFDIHVVYEPPGNFRLLERDRDRDGKYEIILYGAQAQAFLRSLSRPGCALDQEGTQQE